jgi:hypothetical protein
LAVVRVAVEVDCGTAVSVPVTVGLRAMVAVGVTAGRWSSSSPEQPAIASASNSNESAATPRRGSIIHPSPKDYDALRELGKSG